MVFQLKIKLHWPKLEHNPFGSQPDHSDRLRIILSKNYAFQINFVWFSKKMSKVVVLLLFCLHNTIWPSVILLILMKLGHHWNIFQVLKIRQFLNEFLMSSFLPKYEQKIVRISALYSEGRNLDNFLFVFREKRRLHKFILKLTDL